MRPSRPPCAVPSSLRTTRFQAGPSPRPAVASAAARRGHAAEGGAPGIGDAGDGGRLDRYGRGRGRAGADGGGLRRPFRAEGEPQSGGGTDGSGGGEERTAVESGGGGPYTGHTRAPRVRTQRRPGSTTALSLWMVGTGSDRYVNATATRRTHHRTGISASPDGHWALCRAVRAGHRTFIRRTDGPGRDRDVPPGSRRFPGYRREVPPGPRARQEPPASLPRGHTASATSTAAQTPSGGSGQ